MNIILFYPEELGKPLPLDDLRSRHILDILKCKEGDSFYAGVVNGLMGKTRLKQIDADSLVLGFHFDTPPPPLYPLHLIVGLSRPQTVKKILQEATSLGVSSILFTGTDTGEKSYTTSKLWTNEEYKTYIKLGAEQAFTTRLPVVKRYYTLKHCLEEVDTGGIPGARVVFDNYRSSVPVRSLPLQSLSITDKGCYIAIGSERGWSEKELALFKAHNFVFSNLGARILRTETACVAAITLILEKMEFM